MGDVLWSIYSLSINCRLIDAEQPRFSSRATFGWKKYHELNDIYKWMDQLIKNHPDELTNYDIGKSYENRTIRAIKLSRKKVSSISILLMLAISVYLSVKCAFFVREIQLFLSNLPSMHGNGSQPQQQLIF